MVGGRIAALIVKELQAILRDRRGRMVLIGPPIVQLFVFAFAATLEVRNVSLAVLDQDRGRWSVELVERLAGTPTFTSVRAVARPAEIAELIDTQEVLAAVHIPQGFSADIAAGRPTTVQIALDGRRSNAAQIVQGYVARIVQAMAADAADAYGRPAPPGTLVVRSWFNPNLIYRWFTVPSLIGTIGLLIGISVTALSVARERELGTFDQLMVSPLTPAEIVIGKSVPSLIIGLVQGTIFLAIATLVFGIPFTGATWLLYASLAVYLVAVIGIGLFISAVAQTQQQAFLGAFVFAAPAILLSGFATPVENMPDWLQALTVVNPLRHFLVIINGLFTKDMPAATVLDNAWPLAVIALCTMSAAAWLFRRRIA
ncbi:MAG: ABC transporter permease [Alphaproteobacteria bacterium]